MSYVTPFKNVKKKNRLLTCKQSGLSNGIMKDRMREKCFVFCMLVHVSGGGVMTLNETIIDYKILSLAECWLVRTYSWLVQWLSTYLFPFWYFKCK